MALLHLLLGLGVLLIGAEIAVRGSIGLARRWGWPGWLTGLVLVAVGTSLPELAVSAQAAGEHPDLALSNVMGSNAFNAGMVLGLLLLAQGRKRVALPTLAIGTVVALVMGSVLCFFIFDEAEIPSMAPWALFGFYGFTLLLGWRDAMSGREKGPELSGEQMQLITALLMTAGGFVALAFASEWFLKGAMSLAESLGWAEGFAGYLITAVGTSAPELATSQRALRHGEPGAVLGNLVGSNAFNLFLAGGTATVLAGKPISPDLLNPQLWVNLCAALALLAPCILAARRRTPSVEMSPLIGGALVGGYLVGSWAVFSVA